MRRCLIGVAAALLALLSSDGAWAHWSATGSGVASATTATLAAATVEVPSSATDTLTVTWNAQASLAPSGPASSQITYIVQRKLAGGSYADVGSGGCSGAKSYGTASCIDAPPDSGSYRYRVRAIYRSWTATSNETGAVAFAVGTAPVVQSIAGLDANPSRAPSLRWTVTFSEPVTGVDSADFALARGGMLAGGDIVSVAGSAATYVVTASTGAGSGMLGLNVTDDDSIVDTAGDTLAGVGTGNGDFTGQTYTIDRTAPVVLSIATSGATPTNAATASWTVTFSEPVSGVDSADLALAGTGTIAASATIQSVTGSGATRTVTASTASGEGTLGLNFASNDTVTDEAGNAVSGSYAGQAYIFDRSAPARTALQMLDTNANGKIDQVKATFNEALAPSAATSAWTLTGVPSGATLAAVAVTGPVATLTLGEGAAAADTATGAFTVALAVSPNGIRDAAGNRASFAAAAPTDLAAPVRTAMAMLDTNTNARIDRVTVRFSELVASPITATAFTLSNVPSGGTLAAATADSNVVALTVSEGSGPATTAAGAFTVALAATDSGVRDSAGNKAAFAAAAPTDAAGPVPLAVSDTSGTTNGRIQTADSFAATFSEPIDPASVPASTTITQDGAAPATDTLKIDGFTNGALDMGSANYVTATSAVSFVGTSALSSANATITITVGACTAACGQQRTGTGTSMIYVPATTLRDGSGNAATGSRSTGFRIF